MNRMYLSESLWPAQTDEPIWETTVGGLLREVAARDPSAPALVEVDVEGETGRRWTYGELLADSERLAHALCTRFSPGERVVVWAPNIPEWVLTEYACALSGLVLVTANPAYQARELRYVLEHSGAVALFLIEGYRGNPMAAIAAEAVEGLAAVREVVDLNDTETLHRHRGSATSPLPSVAPGDAAQIQYTSGTTGFPKGAVLCHRGLVNNARFYAARCRTRVDSTWINFMPMFHTTGCSMITLGVLSVGCRMVLMALFDPALVVRQIERERVTCILGVPTMVVGLLEHLERHPADLSSVEMVSSGGAMVAPELVRKTREVFGATYQTVYGQTEFSPLVTQHHHDDTPEDISNNTGRPIPQTAVSIRDVEHNAIVPVGTVGEICVRGCSRMLGYHGDAAATGAAIDAEGWLHTGDLGTMDERGYLRVTGRVKEMIIRGGENHFPAEIENVLLEHPAVTEVAVVGLPDEKWGEVIGCFIRSEGDAPLDIEDLRRHCRANLSPQKTPTVWRRVDEFPLTGSRKIQKFRLREQFLAGEHEAE